MACGWSKNRSPCFWHSCRPSQAASQPSWRICCWGQNPVTQLRAAARALSPARPLSQGLPAKALDCLEAWGAGGGRLAKAPTHLALGLGLLTCLLPFPGEAAGGRGQLEPSPSLCLSVFPVTASSPSQAIGLVPSPVLLNLWD